MFHPISKRLPIMFSLVFAMLVTALAIGRSADAGPPSTGPDAVGAVTEVRSDGVQITRYKDSVGRDRMHVQLPAVNAANPYFEAVVGEGESAVTLYAQFNDPMAPPKVASSRPPGIGSSASGNNSSTIYKSCQSGWGRSFNLHWVKLTTYWNYDYSTLWGLSNAKQSFSGYGFSWKGFGLWTSGGPQFAYSDIVAELWSGWFPLELQISSDHMWHQVDAWGNCGTHYDLWP